MSPLLKIQFNASEQTFREGDPANRFYLIQRGQVALESSLKDRPTVAAHSDEG